MECKHWNEHGLLYMSNELDVETKDAFELHIRECVICKDEVVVYNNLKEKYFVPELLEESPTRETDDEIIRVCSHNKIRPTYTPFIFSTRLHQVVTSLVLLFIGFGIGSYYISNIKSSSVVSSINNETPIIKNSTVENGGVAFKSSEGKNDTTVKNDDSIGVKIQKGNLTGNGIITVNIGEDQ